MEEFPVPSTTRAHQIVAAEGLRIWRHRGSEGVNVYDEALMQQLQEAGCVIRPYSPEAIGNPSRIAWEAVLPKTDHYPPLEVVRDGME